VKDCADLAAAWAALAVPPIVASEPERRRAGCALHLHRLRFHIYTHCISALKVLKRPAANMVNRAAHLQAQDANMLPFTSQ